MSTTRRDFLARTALTLSGVALGQRALFGAAMQGGPPPTTPAFTAIRRNVGFFMARGGTIGYLISPSGVVVVDSQFADTAPLCLAGINERSKNRPVDMLINTHHHGDHTGGNLAFKNATQRVVAHATAAAHMKQPPGRPAPTAENYYPTETFTDTWRATVGDETVRARYYGPAHSGGDAVITFEQANVAHMGDLMFTGRQPAVDRPAGARLPGWITVLERTVTDHAADTVYIFGHSGGPQPVTGPRAELMRFRDYLTALLEHVRAEMKAGRTKEQIAAGTGLIKGFEAYGPLNTTVQNAAYDDLVGA